MAKEDKSSFLERTLKTDITQAQEREEIRTMQVSRALGSVADAPAKKKPLVHINWLRIGVLGFIILIFVLLAGTVAVQLFYVNPILTVKPLLAKPQFDADQLSENHIIYVMNELRAYKLHAAPHDQDPARIEFYVVDMDERFAVGVEENFVKAVKSGRSTNIDMRITMESRYLQQLLDSSNAQAVAKQLVSDAKIDIDLVASKDELALKGYQTVLNSIALEDDHVNLLNLFAMTKAIGNILYIIAVIILASFGTWYIFKK